MSRRCLCAMTAALAGVLVLSGCSSDKDGSARTLRPPADQFQLIGEPDFDWYLSGDRRVAPLQIFSDQWRVWLQWHPGQPVPSVFVLDAGQWQVAEPRRHGKFSVIDGQWRQLRFQGGMLRADARHGREHFNASRQPQVRERPASAIASSATDTQGARQKFEADLFELQMQDQTIRQALMRWAADHRWHFENGHWAVPVDLPITASARFEGSFISAVRALLAATDIAGRPLQPCFYANRVLRVISANESCDPTAKQIGGQ
ncbi:hypothetical protein DBV39_07135 [Orrella marina]|uniref:Toxin co-regulated pilus biosynthesis protein Q C-terminal domain-containing protein n=2 Tax=Orrella marina TaxID=2163011 RepID=A0A2R4XI94_9BURK|nr:hypothetical protein DBV39_07135 [Orrella marina]